MPSNFDNAARFYDGLSQMVYGKALVKSQIYLLGFIPPDSNILIVGGGTGWILEELTKIHASGLKITYVEISANMMALSRKRNMGSNRVDFITCAVEDMVADIEYNVVITPFLFDNFTEQTLQKAFANIHQYLKPGGLWLNADFQITGKLWQKLLLKSMYVFFRMLCSIEAQLMPDIKRHFVINNYKELSSKTYFGNFIIAKCLLKANSPLNQS